MNRLWLIYLQFSLFTWVIWTGHRRKWRTKGTLWSEEHSSWTAWLAAARRGREHSHWPRSWRERRRRPGWRSWGWRDARRRPQWCCWSQCFHPSSGQWAKCNSGVQIVAQTRGSLRIDRDLKYFNIIDNDNTQTFKRFELFEIMSHKFQRFPIPSSDEKND